MVFRKGDEAFGAFATGYFAVFTGEGVDGELNFRLSKLGFNGWLVGKRAESFLDGDSGAWLPLDEAVEIPTK